MIAICQSVIQSLPKGPNLCISQAVLVSPLLKLSKQSSYHQFHTHHTIPFVWHSIPAKPFTSNFSVDIFAESRRYPQNMAATALRAFNHSSCQQQPFKVRQEQFRARQQNEWTIRFFLSTLKVSPIYSNKKRTPESALRNPEARRWDSLQDDREAGRRVRFAPGTANNIMKPRPKRVKRRVVEQMSEESQKKKRWHKFSWLVKLFTFFRRSRKEDTRCEI